MTATARNPILPGTYPDPSVCRVGDTYWLVTSTFEYFPGLPVFRSTDLVHWEQVGHVIDRAEQLDYQGLRWSHGLYAPTIRFHDGLFWVVCTLVGTPEGAPGGNFLVTATDPAGPWSDPVWLDEAGIDPSLFFDDDGRVWVHGTRLAADPEWDQQTEVWIRELDRDTLRLTGPEHVVWTGAVRGAVWAEGPHLYKVDGTYYLLAAEGGTDIHHAISVARADVVTGPYEGNKANPVLTHRHLGRGMDVTGVGHADLVQAVDGSWWALLLAMRPYGGYHYNLGRETFLVPVTWEDGWPVFAPGVGRVPAEVTVPFGSDDAALGEAQGTTSGVVPPSSLRWTTLRGPAAFATPDGDGWRLALRPATLAEHVTPSFLGVRQQHQDVDVRVSLVDALLADGEEAGLVVRQNERDHVRLAVIAGAEGRQAVVTHRRAGVDAEIGSLALPDGPVALAMSARGQDYAFLVGDEQLAVGDEQLAVVDGRTLDSTVTGGFTGVWVGIYATSNGRPTSTEVSFGPFEYLPQ